MTEKARTRAGGSPGAAMSMFASLASQDVTDLYTGDCRGCGECCSRFLPMTPFDEVRLSAFVSARGIEQRPPRAEVDLTCPYLSDDGLCAVYQARPEICRAYRCDLHASGTMEPPADMASMRLVDLRGEAAL